MCVASPVVVTPHFSGIAPRDMGTQQRIIPQGEGVKVEEEEINRGRYSKGGRAKSFLTAISLYGTDTVKGEQSV